MALSVGEIEATLRLRDQMTGELARATSGLDLFKIGATAAAAAAAALGVAMIASVNEAIKFESSFAGVRKTVDASEEEFAALSAGFRELATEIPISVNELNRIGEAAGQLGIETENILGFTRVMADLGVTTNLSADQAASSLARLANITQMPQAEFERLGSTIVALGNTLATTEAEITEFGLRIAGAGTQAGLTEAEILSIGAAMSSVGVEAEAGGTAVQKVLLGMTQAVAQGNEDLAVFAETAGMSAQQFAEAWETDAAGAFTAFVEGLGAAGTDAFNILEALDLQDQRLIRSFLALSGAGDLLRTSIETGTTAWTENLALTTEAEQRYATTASQLAIMQGQIRDAAIELGTMVIQNEAVALAVASLSDFLGTLTERIVENREEIERWITDGANAAVEVGTRLTEWMERQSRVQTEQQASLVTLTNELDRFARSLGLLPGQEVAESLDVSSSALDRFGEALAGVWKVGLGLDMTPVLDALGLVVQTTNDAMAQVGLFSAKMAALPDIGKPIEDTAMTFDQLATSGAATAVSMEAVKNEVTEQQKAWNALAPTMSTAADEQKKLGDGTRLTAEQLEEMAEAQAFVTKSIADFNVEAGKALGINAALFTSFESLTTQYQRISDAEIAARIASVALWDAVQAGASAAIGPTEEMVRQIEAFATISQGATGIWEQFSFSVADQLKIGGEEGGESFWDGFSGVLESALSSVPRLIEDALTGGADLARAGKAIAVEFASAFMSALGSAISGGSALVASAFGAIGGAGAVLVSALFGSLIETDFEKVGKELAERFGQSFSEELQRQVEQSFKEFGDRGAAVLANLSDIVTELGGVTAENFALIVAQADDLVLQFARRTLDLETVTRELAAVYPQLAAEFENAGAAGQQAFVDLTTQALTFGTIDLPTVIQAIEDIGKSFVDLDAAGQQAFLDLILAAKEFGATTEDLIKAVADPFASVLGPALALVAENSELASQELLNVIAVAQQLGVATAEIAQFLEQMQALGLTGLQGLLTNIFPGEDVAALADVFLDTFQTLLDAGLSFDEALKALGPGLDNLIVKMQEAGLEGTEAFQRITDIANQAGNEIINTAVAAAQAAVDVLVSLNNQALLDQKTFSALAQTIVQAFEALQNEGVAGEDALRRLQPELQKIWELQQDFNFIVDEGTKALLDQAVAAGFVGDQFRSESSQMLDAMQGVFLILLAIAEALGAKIPDSLTKMANEMRFAASGGVESMSDLEIAIGDVATTAEQVGETVHQELSQAAKDSSEAMAKAMDEISREAEKTGKTIEDEITNGANAAAVAMGDAAASMIKDLQDVQRQAEETGGASPTGVEMITFRIHEAMDAMGRAAGQMVADLSRVGAVAEGIGLPMLAASVGVTASVRPSVTPAFTSISLPENSLTSTVLQPIVLQVDGQVLTRIMVRIAPRVLSTLGV